MATPREIFDHASGVLRRSMATHTVSVRRPAAGPLPPVQLTGLRAAPTYRTDADIPAFVASPVGDRSPSTTATLAATVTVRLADLENTGEPATDAEVLVSLAGEDAAWLRVVDVPRVDLVTGEADLIVARSAG